MSDSRVDICFRCKSDSTHRTFGNDFSSSEGGAVWDIWECKECGATWDDDFPAPQADQETGGEG